MISQPTCLALIVLPRDRQGHCRLQWPHCVLAGELWLKQNILWGIGAVENFGKVRRSTSEAPTPPTAFRIFCVLPPKSPKVVLTCATLTRYRRIIKVQTWRTTFRSQDRQVLLKLVLSHLSPVLVPLDLLVLDESIKYMVAQGFSHQITLFRELDRLDKAGR